MTAPRVRHVTLRSTIVPIEGEEREGHVRALVSAYNVEYRIDGGRHEVIRPGALYTRRERVPMFYEHDWHGAPIGEVSGESVEGGFLVDGDLYFESDPKVARLHRALKSGSLDEWSIGFIAEDVSHPRPNVDAIDRGQVVEVSLTVLGANPGTTTVSARNAEDEQPAALGPGEVDPWSLLATEEGRRLVREALSSAAQSSS